MRRLTALAVSFVAACALAGLVTVSASAVVLPEFTVETKSTGTSGTGKLNLTGAAIACTSGTSSLSPTSKKLGTATFTFTGCKLKGEPCHSLADTGETILVGTEGASSAEYHLVRLAGNDPGIWFLIPAVHIECKFESVLVVVQGNVLGLIEKPGEDTTSFKVNLNVVAGKQEITEFENNSGEKVKAKLEGSINGGAFKVATEESASNKLTTEKLTEILDLEYETESSIESAGVGTFKFSEEVEVVCNQAKLAASPGAGLHQTLSLAPRYEECTGTEAAFGAGKGNFSVSAKCNLRFNTLKELPPAGSGEYKASVDLIDNTCVIKFGEALVCAVTIKGEQLGVGTVIIRKLKFLPLLEAELVLALNVAFTAEGACVLLKLVPAAGNVQFTSTTNLKGGVVR